MINTTLVWITRFVGISFVFGFGAASAVEEPIVPVSRFEIVRYQVDGNTLLPVKDVDQMLTPFTGKDQDFGSVQKAVETLESAYRKNGFDIVRVVLPEQELNQGVVHLLVIETKVNKITVSGNKFFDDANIRRSLPALQEGKTPNMANVSANLKVANENPAKKITVKLESGEQEGTVNAALNIVDEKTWTGVISVDSTGDEQTGRNRVTALYQNANIGGWDHVLSMQYTTSLSHPNDVTIAGAGYHVPLYSLGDSLDFFGFYSNVDSGTITAGVLNFGVSGNGTVLGSRYNHNLLKVGDYTSVLFGEIDYKAFSQNVTLFGAQLAGVSRCIQLAPPTPATGLSLTQH